MSRFNFEISPYVLLNDVYKRKEIKFIRFTFVPDLATPIFTSLPSANQILPSKESPSLADEIMCELYGEKGGRKRSNDSLDSHEDEDNVYEKIYQPLDDPDFKTTQETSWDNSAVKAQLLKGKEIF